MDDDDGPWVTLPVARGRRPAAAVSLTATIVSLPGPDRLFTPQQQLRRLGA